MSKRLLAALTLEFAVCTSAHSAQSDAAKVFDEVQTGIASYYNSRFEGRRTANGDTFRQNAYTAAHPSLPFGTLVRVTNLAKGHFVDVRITDRLPSRRAIIDLTRKAAGQLNMLQAGRVRVIGVSTAERLSGALAHVPTWKEQGANAVVSNWYGMVGAPGINASQVAYWDGVFSALVNTEVWRDDLKKNLRDSHYMNGHDVRKFWDTQYGEWKEILTELGLAKQVD